VAAYSHDGTAYVNSFNNPGVTADLPEVVIPDTSMFQSPLYQWFAGTVEASAGDEATTLPDEISEQDGSAIGSPTYRPDQLSLETVEADGNDDGYTYSPTSNHPSGDDTWSIASTVQVVSDGYFIWWGERADKQLVNLEFDSGTLALDNYGVGSATTTLPYDQLVTIGARYDGSDTKVYVNGGENTGTNNVGTLDVKNTNHSIAFDADSNSNFCGVYIHELIISNSSESDQAFADYHNTRLG
jgi:hypothetical protein